MSENGHTNGKAIALADQLATDKHGRQNVRLMIATLEDHNARGIPLKPELIEAYQIVCARLMQSQHERVQVSALNAIHAALRYNLDLFDKADKMTRLDDGRPTENVEHVILKASFK